MTDPQSDTIDDLAQLRALFGPVSPLAEFKVQSRLDEHLRRFIGLSPFLVLATSDGEGHVDASPRGDGPGFVQVLDDATLLVPDRPGNNRADSYQNIVLHPGVGLIFFVPGIDETVRVNGRATIVTSTGLLEPTAVRGKVPRAGLRVTVEEAFFHCGKALKRSALWDSERRLERSAFPSLGRIIAEQTRRIEPAEAEAKIARDYVDKLY
jgi:PPOX class probable FMN-dependent enzyme